MKGEEEEGSKRMALGRSRVIPLFLYLEEEREGWRVYEVLEGEGRRECWVKGIA